MHRHRLYCQGRDNYYFMKYYFNIDYDLCTKLHLKIEGREKKNWESLQINAQKTTTKRKSAFI